ncbi:GFA family protein [Vibrio owensii]|uniref:GFA family protein n=1 Tax=Vibrio owensii TaxID=696485 RepID=UPI00215BB939|nr:GFA family protein [Vibrio owensii]MCR9939416.1 GFA family protein [Vibrio owensii]
MEINKVHKAKCHCGAVELELTLPNGLEDPRRCSCSMCRKRGAIAASVLLENLKIVKGENNLTLYQFNTMTAKHFFCKTCGIYTHHQRRSNPHQFAINVACLEGVNPYELEPVKIYDGIHHPSDKIGL